MKIINMTKIKNPLDQRRAYFSIETKTTVFRAMRLIEANDGKLYADYPKYKDKRGDIWKWYEFNDLDFLRAITEAAREAYEKIK